ncbi:sensor histidine kinase [Taibaiella chishuiensis]|uniref:Histidine kinase n=1 Tax=Taibaiella chishuiensis TaxID=1434707 RepID=A0A2P8CW78_9BACT|nr:histidine kinase [Taibaiella chishuiensis]PSK89231.1 histidine kinase [Taibaiella chishuiensis]
MSQPFKTANIKVSSAILLLLISIGQFYWLWTRKDFSLEIALVDALGSNALLYGIFIFLEYGFNYYLPPVARLGVIGVQSMIFAAAWILICQWTLHTLYPDNVRYQEFWTETIYIRGLIGWILLCDYNIINYFLGRLTKQEFISEQEQNSIQLRKEAELFKLRQQLHPHFLFNSLNSINALIGKEPKHARTMVQQLSEFLRHTLKKEDNELITFREEMDDLHIYLSIEQVRFGHRLTIAEDIDVGCMDIRTPPFLFQPLVENAIKYGLYGTTGPVKILIKARVEDQQLVFSIINPYDPDAVTTKGTGFGLESVRRRLYLLFARNDLLSVRMEKAPEALAAEAGADASHHFTAILKIPLHLEKTGTEPAD